jgi:hypothetical protein
MMNRSKLLFWVLVAPLALAGCATTDSSVPAGVGIGAAGGALLGYGLTGSATGAAAGAGAGALAGAVTGVVIDESRRSSAPPPQSYQSPPPQYQSAPQAYAPDPTRGEFLNSTNWRLEVFVDGDRQPIHLNPRESYPISLDLGTHEIVATAFVRTQHGERPVGTYRQNVHVDARGSGWSLRFNERMF